MSKWQILKFSATAENAEKFSDLLLILGAVSVALTDKEDNPIFEPDPGETPLWQNLWIHATFATEINLKKHIKSLEKLSQQKITPYQILDLPEQDWVKSWQLNFHALQFGKRLWICPSHELINNPNKVIVKLDPGLAFGTGTHPTTKLCLEWLDQNIKGGETVIDYGCGSGILAIAALKLGASFAWGIDIDTQALTATQENAIKNDIDPQKLKTTYPKELKNYQADILIANILLDPLLNLAPYLTHLVKPRGKIVLSGILKDQVSQVVKCYQTWFANMSIEHIDGWVRLCGLASIEGDQNIHLNYGEKK